MSAVVAPETSDADFAIGSDAHLTLFCRMLLNTHIRYKPAHQVWPEIDDDTRARLLSLSIWDRAVQTETRASVLIRSFAGCVEDSLLKRAIEMNAFEEVRHRELLINLTAFYGIALPREPAYPRPVDCERGFMRVGYSECIDSFFAFGLFTLAERSGFFPSELVRIFEPVMQEECRHILFFYNWMVWHRARLSWWRRIIFDARRARVFVGLIYERLTILFRMGAEAIRTGRSNLVEIDVSPNTVLGACLAENDRRMAAYDARLLRPTFVPTLARLARFLTN
jgi:hypothetical protein